MFRGTNYVQLFQTESVAVSCQKVRLLIYHKFGYLIGLLPFQFCFLGLSTEEWKHVNAHFVLNIFAVYVYTTYLPHIALENLQL